MKPGSLVVTTFDYKEITRDVNFVGVVPDPNGVYTCHTIDGSGLSIDESFPIMRRTGQPCKFAPQYWKEVQGPEEVSVQDIVEESIHELI